VCGEGDPSFLEYYDSGERDAGVGRMVSNRRPIAAVRTEVERCANYHWREHHELAEPGDR
jgi:hypothetical protein